MKRPKFLFLNLVLVIFGVSICLAETPKVIERAALLPNTTLVDRHNQQHHLAKPEKGEGMIDTLRWYVGEPLDMLDYVTTLDTIIVWFYPLVTCSLVEIRANFADEAEYGWLRVSIAQRNEADTCCLSFNENLLFESIAWTGIDGGNQWYKMDFTHMWPPEYFQLELPGDTAFYVIMQTAKDGYPHINWDDCEGFTRTEGPPHFRFTYDHATNESPNCEGMRCSRWYYVIYMSDPPVYPELLVEAIIKYPKAPVEVQMTHLPDTYSIKGPFQVCASIWDPGKVVDMVFLNSHLRGIQAILTTKMQLQEDSTYVGQIGREYTVGDTIDYWITCHRLGASDTTFFIIRECDPEAEILLVSDNGGGRGKYYQAILDSLGYSYNYWDVAEYGGISSDILNYGNWETVILFGCGCVTTPGKTYTGDMWTDFLAQGGNILYPDQDYFCAHSDSLDYPGGCQFEGDLSEGEFLYDYFGVSWAKSNPEYRDTLFRGLDTVVVGEENVGGTFGLHTSHLEIEAWPDYTQAKAGAFNLFEAALGDTTCGTRYESTVSGETFKTVFIPFPLEALCDYNDYEDRIVVTPEAYTIMQNIVAWFETSVGVKEGKDKEDHLPTLFALSQNYPNPFNPTTRIKYSLLKGCYVRLEVYNLLGQRVATLVDGKQAPGYKAATWDAKDMASGIYFYRLKADEFTAIKKMILLK